MARKHPPVRSTGIKLSNWLPPVAAKRIWRPSSSLLSKQYEIALGKTISMPGVAPALLVRNVGTSRSSSLNEPLTIENEILSRAFCYAGDRALVLTHVKSARADGSRDGITLTPVLRGATPELRAFIG